LPQELGVGVLAIWVYVMKVTVDVSKIIDVEAHTEQVLFEIVVGDMVLVLEVLFIEGVGMTDGTEEVGADVSVVGVGEDGSVVELEEVGSVVELAEEVSVELEEEVSAVELEEEVSAVELVARRFGRSSSRACRVDVG
jgi:hypothetical protein